MGDRRLSNRIVADRFSYSREVCKLSMENKYTNRGRISDRGHIVQIDELEGNWILGVIDTNSSEVQMDVYPNNNRDGNTLYNLITKHVELASMIHMDWGICSPLHCDPVTNAQRITLSHAGVLFVIVSLGAAFGWGW